MDHLQEFERIARFEADYFEVDIPRDKPTITIVELDPTLKPDDKNAPQISCYDAKPNIIYVPKNPDPTVMPEHTTQWLHSKNNTRLRNKMDGLAHKLDASHVGGLEKALPEGEIVRIQRELELCGSLTTLISGLGTLGYLKHIGRKDEIDRWKSYVTAGYRNCEEIGRITGQSIHEMFQMLGYVTAADHFEKINKRLRRRLFMIDSFTEATGYLIQEDLPDVPPEVISKLLREISKSKK